MLQPSEIKEPSETKVSIVGFNKFLIAARWIGQAKTITTKTDSTITNQIEIGAIG